MTDRNNWIEIPPTRFNRIWAIAEGADFDGVELCSEHERAECAIELRRLIREHGQPVFACKANESPFGMVATAWKRKTKRVA